MINFLSINFLNGEKKGPKSETAENVGSFKTLFARKQRKREFIS